MRAAARLSAHRLRLFDFDRRVFDRGKVVGNGLLDVLVPGRAESLTLLADLAVAKSILSVTILADTVLSGRHQGEQPGPEIFVPLLLVI